MFSGLNRCKAEFSVQFLVLTVKIVIDHAVDVQLTYAVICCVIESTVEYISKESAIGLYTPSPAMFLNILWPSVKYVMHRHTSCTWITSTKRNASNAGAASLPTTVLYQYWHIPVVSPYTSEHFLQLNDVDSDNCWKALIGAT